MKKIVSLLLALMIVLTTMVSLASCGEQKEKLYVYNWGEYIADGDEGSVNLIEVFEELYDIDVIYDTYDSNETMYPMLKNDVAKYDVIIPSDYMIARLIEEDLLQEINFDNIPNYEHIDTKYTNLYYDPTNSYSVPYNVGMVGVVYDAQAVDASSQSWDLLWDARYTGDIYNFDNPRDGFMTAQMLLGLDVNSTKAEDWETAKDKLIEQKAVLQGYGMDEMFAKMEGGNAKIATYYAGDCLSMMDENEKLDFYYPEEGTNIFIDAMCIPKNAQNVSAAEKFINFMLEPEYAIENALYLYYASPNTAVSGSDEYKEALGQDCYDILYKFPESYLDADGKLVKAHYYHNLPDEILTLVDSLWLEVKQD